MLFATADEVMTMRRREFVAGAAFLAAVSRATAQQSAKSQRLAILSPSFAEAAIQENSRNHIGAPSLPKCGGLGMSKAKT